MTVLAPSRTFVPDPSAALARFEDPVLLERGVVSLIALDAVREALGGRWRGRREQIHEHVERCLERRLGPASYFVRVSETDFVVAQPEKSRYAAQGCCLRVMRELLEHFLGRITPELLVVRRVTRLADGAIDAEEVPASEIEEEAEDAAPAAEAPTFSEARWNPFVANNGQTLRVACLLEPLFEMRGFGRIGFRIRRRVFSEDGTPIREELIARMPRADVARVDLATIARGVAECVARDEEKQATLLVPISHITASSLKERAALVDCLRQAAQVVNRGVLTELCEVDFAPSSAVLSAAAVLRPYSAVILARLLLPPGAPLDHLGHLGLQGLSFESKGCPRGDAAFSRWVEKRIQAARPVGRSVVIHGVPNARYAALAKLAGATHVTVHEPKSHYV